MAFRATQIFRMSERYDVHPALKKVIKSPLLISLHNKHIFQLWKKHYQVDGMVTQHLSPFEQKIVSPMLKDAPLKIAKKLKEYTFEAGAGTYTQFIVLGDVIAF